MIAKLIEGKKLSQKIKENIKNQVQEFAKKGIVPGLAVIMLGEDPSSLIYVNLKKKACQELGIKSYSYMLKESATEQELLKLIEKLNNDHNVNGILVQSPLPPHIDEKKIVISIDSLKDVDCFHPINVGNLASGFPRFFPCTPAGIIRIIEENQYEIEGKECVVIGRSNIVGKPTALMLLSKNGTVTMCHSKTKNLKEISKRADILVVAIGKPNFIDDSFVKPGAVVIDVGISRLNGNKVVGDVNFESVSKVASAITPVPGGVGPMTIAMLMENLLKAFKIQQS